MTPGAARLRWASAWIQACLGDAVVVNGMTITIPGPWQTRLSVVGGNRRILRLIDRASYSGAVVVDVGANIGYNTVYAAQRVGSTGRVIAVEPAADNLAVLRANVAQNGLQNVLVKAVAAGRESGTRALYLRGDISAVNSFFPESCYAEVTGIAEVPVAPLDELVEDVDAVALVKIDVEGAELDVLAGMPRLLAVPGIQLIVEWHPLLQDAAGYRPDELPLALLRQGFMVRGVGHVRTRDLAAEHVPALLGRLHRSGRPVELHAFRGNEFTPSR